MISISGLTKSFETPRGKITVLNDFSLEIKDGTFLYLKLFGMLKMTA